MNKSSVFWGVWGFKGFVSLRFDGDMEGSVDISEGLKGNKCL